jgi:peroxiredoxin Q/BCP
MALNLGTQAPDFVLPSTEGKDFSLYRDQMGKACIVYFYPKDFTPGCEKEACDFRDKFSEIRKNNVDIYGISTDDIASHIKFREKYNLPFHLLSDKGGTVSKLYEAAIPLLKISKRVSYLLDESLIIVAAYDNFFGAHLHIKRLLEKIS